MVFKYKIPYLMFVQLQGMKTERVGGKVSEHTTTVLVTLPVQCGNYCFIITINYHL